MWKTASEERWRKMVSSWKQKAEQRWGDSFPFIKGFCTGQQWFVFLVCWERDKTQWDGRIGMTVGKKRVKSWGSVPKENREWRHHQGFQEKDP